jgi:hypothetical protein
MKYVIGMIEMKVELEMEIEQRDGAEVLQKLSRLANKAKELGFIVTEAEVESDDKKEEEEEEEEKEVRKSNLNDMKSRRQNLANLQKQTEKPAARKR